MSGSVTRDGFIAAKREEFRETYRNDQDELLSSARDDGVSPEQFLTAMAESLADLYLEECGGYFIDPPHQDKTQ